MRVREDRRQRLVQLVRDRRRQLSHGSHAVEMRDLAQVAARGGLVLPSPGDVEMHHRRATFEVRDVAHAHLEPAVLPVA